MSCDPIQRKFRPTLSFVRSVANLSYVIRPEGRDYVPQLLLHSCKSRFLGSPVLHWARAPINSNSVGISERPAVTSCDTGNARHEFWH